MTQDSSNQNPGSSPQGQPSSGDGSRPRPSRGGRRPKRKPSEGAASTPSNVAPSTAADSAAESKPKPPARKRKKPSAPAAATTSGMTPATTTGETEKTEAAKPKSSSPRKGRSPKPASSDGAKGGRSAARSGKSPSTKTVKVIPIGGLDGIGKNMTVIEYGDDMIVVDAGIMFPDDDHPGVDLILPDYSYVVENAHKLRAIIVTHGHEDHTGAIPYLLKDLRVKPQIIATGLTLGLIGGKLEEHKLRDVKLNQVKGGDRITLGAFNIEFFRVNHSIPDAVGVFIETPIGNILHTGDFKLDQTPIDGKVTDYAALARFGAQGVMVLLSDSTNAESPGFTKSEAEVGAALVPIIASAKGKVIVASFSSHIHRLQQVADAAISSGRKVVVTGRSMLQNTAIARRLGYLGIPDGDILDAFDMHDIAPEDIVILCTGSQGEPLSALSRMAAGEHRTIRIRPEDTVIISATPVPGNEKAVSNVVNRLTKIGCEVYDKRRAGVHVSGHAAAEELKLMLNLTRPEYFVPVHGETRHLAAHKSLAEKVGIPSDYVFVLENGDILEFDKDGATVSGAVQSGVIYVDGLNVGDMDSVVLRDRAHLAKDGIITIVFTVDTKHGTVVGAPEIVLRGVSVQGEDKFISELTERAIKSLDRTVRDRAELSVSRRAVRESMSQFVWERIRRRPMVIPVILEV